ncbi:MAG: hypothetical protein DRN61_04675 [Thaumarchaeota archaeon]|nr:MAG: hypothetical protein DRN61_04675 [Nitrososphaerota archaeon]
MGVAVQPRPLTRRGRALVAFTALGLAFMWAAALHAYLALPEEALVPTHFGPGGEPTSWGSKDALLWLALALSAAPLVILAAVKFRFTLLERAPYLLSLPAFLTRLHELSFEERGRWVNMYFEALAGLGAALTYLMLYLYLALLQALSSGQLSGLVVPSTMTSVIALLAAFLLYLRRLSRRLAAQLKALHAQA